MPNFNFGSAARVAIGDREIRITSRDVSGCDVVLVIKDPIYVDESRVREIVEYELTKEIEEKKALVKKLNSLLAPRLYEPVVSDETMEEVKRFLTNRGDKITDLLVQEIEALKKYTAWLETENEHVKDFFVVQNRVRELEACLRDTRDTLIRLKGCNPIWLSEDLIEFIGNVLGVEKEASCEVQASE